jgi:hypothetical protein
MAARLPAVAWQQRLAYCAFFPVSLACQAHGLHLAGVLDAPLVLCVEG